MLRNPDINNRNRNDYFYKCINREFVRSVVLIITVIIAFFFLLKITKDKKDLNNHSVCSIEYYYYHKSYLNFLEINTEQAVPTHTLIGIHFHIT